MVQLLTALMAVPGFGASTSGAPSGAIFTTDENGTRVNQNIYDDKRDVYLDGGPGPNAPQTAAGLDDGNYYFQVTGTDGKTLFSTDPVKCREFRVKDGIIVEYVSANRTYPVTGGYRFCHLDGKEFGRHDTGVDSDHHAVTIQLMPYSNTSNPGGVYKAWITPVEEFQGNASNVDNTCDSGCEHGFKHSASKTDNFKVKTTSTFVAPTLTVRKFDDWDGDGAWDSGESEIGVTAKFNGGGWAVAVVDPAGAASYGYTPYLYYTGFAGNYTAVEGTASGWVQTALIVDGTAMAVNTSAKVAVAYASGETHTVTYGNFRCFVVSGAKVSDADGDGKWDSNEATLSGWGIQLYRNGALYANTTTGSDGKYSFTVCKGGSFVVKEVNQDGWTQTGAKDYSFTGRSGVNHNDLVFTNHQDSTTSCGLLCISLNVPVSVSVDLGVTVGADVGTSDCTVVLSTVNIGADVGFDANATGSNCGCDTVVGATVDLTADVTVGASGGSDTCTSSCNDTCTSQCSPPPDTCTTSCGDTSADVGVDVGVDVGADVSGGSSSCTDSCENTCTSSCESSCTSSCGSTETSADASADVSADVGVDLGACGCEGTSADVSVGADVGADVGLGL